MSTVIQTGTKTRDPQVILNSVQSHIRHLTINVMDGGTLWEREIALLLRDNMMVRNMAERILGQAVAYTISAMENPQVHLGVGQLVDIGVHQLILDTPVHFGLCDVYNGGACKHHAPLIQRRSDGLCLRTGDLLRAEGWDIDEELRAIDGANCSPAPDAPSRIHRGHPQKPGDSRTAPDLPHRDLGAVRRLRVRYAALATVL